MSRIDDMEVKVHGRRRGGLVWNSKEESVAEEGRFGVLSSPMTLAQGVNVPNAQWTGVVTGIALSMLEADMVDAVVCIASDDDSSGDEGGGGGGWSEPVPIIARTKEEVLRGRGVKPALAPSLKVLDEIREDEGIERLLFCGVGCAVQAFRKVQDELNLQKVYVLGTNCVDNSPTPQAARDFLKKGVSIDNIKNVKGYEFMQDFRVHVKMSDNTYIKKPYFSLAGTIADTAIADSCLACFDYTNALADVVVGYMGAPLDSNGEMNTSFQTLTIRNNNGEKMVQTALDANRIKIGDVAKGSGVHEKITMATVNADSIVLKMIGGDVKEQGMPKVVGEVMASLFRFIGPKGVNFARYSIDYHLLRNYLHVLYEWGEERVEDSGKEEEVMPQYARDIVEWYLVEDDSFRELREKVLVASREKKTAGL